MTGQISPEKRSWVMNRVKGIDTKPWKQQGQVLKLDKVSRKVLYWSHLKLSANNFRGMLMARPLRITYTTPFYHVTSWGNEGRNLFKRKFDRGGNSRSYGLGVKILKYSLKMSSFKTWPCCFRWNLQSQGSVSLSNARSGSCPTSERCPQRLSDRTHSTSWSVVLRQMPHGRALYRKTGNNFIERTTWEKWDWLTDESSVNFSLAP